MSFLKNLSDLTEYYKAQNYSPREAAKMADQQLERERERAERESERQLELARLSGIFAIFIFCASFTTLYFCFNCLVEKQKFDLQNQQLENQLQTQQLQLQALEIVKLKGEHILCKTVISFIFLTLFIRGYFGTVERND